MRFKNILLAVSAVALVNAVDTSQAALNAECVKNAEAYLLANPSLKNLTPAASCRKCVNDSLKGCGLKAGDKFSPEEQDCYTGEIASCQAKEGTGAVPDLGAGIFG